MLNRPQESMKKLWGQRILHIIIILVCWSFFYYLEDVYLRYEIFNIKHFISQLYDYNWNFSFWYLYAYIPLLISMPLLKRLAQNLSNKEYLYLLTIYIGYSMIIPTVQYLLTYGKHSLNSDFSLEWMSTYIVIFPLVGYFLEHRCKDFWSVKKIVVLWIINIGTIFMSSYLTYVHAKIAGENSQTFHSMFVFINCITIFVTIQYIYKHTKILVKFKGLIKSVGECTFGIYLLHVFIKDYSGLTVYMYSHLQSGIPAMSFTFLYSAAVFLCCYVIIWIIKHIPFLRNMV